MKNKSKYSILWLATVTTIALGSYTLWTQNNPGQEAHDAYESWPRAPARIELTVQDVAGNAFTGACYCRLSLGQTSYEGIAVPNNNGLTNFDFNLNIADVVGEGELAATVKGQLEVWPDSGARPAALENFLCTSPAQGEASIESVTLSYTRVHPEVLYASRTVAIIAPPPYFGEVIITSPVSRPVQIGSTPFHGLDEAYIARLRNSNDRINVGSNQTSYSIYRWDGSNGALIGIFSDSGEMLSSAPLRRSGTVTLDGSPLHQVDVSILTPTPVGQSWILIFDASTPQPPVPSGFAANTLHFLGQQRAAIGLLHLEPSVTTDTIRLLDGNYRFELWERSVNGSGTPSRSITRTVTAQVVSSSTVSL